MNFYPLPNIKFNGNCFISNNNDRSLDAVNLYICYELDRWSRDLEADFTDKYKYSGYGTRFNSRSEFLFTDGSYGKHVIIFGADMRSSVHVDNK